MNSVQLKTDSNIKEQRGNAGSLYQLLADTVNLRDLYEKRPWQTSGRMFYQVHLLFGKHLREQTQLVNLVTERIQTLGSVTLAMAPDEAEMTPISRPPRDRENVQAQLLHLLRAHEIVLKEARTLARHATGNDDAGTKDILERRVIRTNELQVWFVSQHFVNM